MRARDLKRWRSGDPVSYAFGALCVLHLLARRPHPRHQPRSGIEVVTDARTVESLSCKGNTWVLAAFGPWADTLSVSADHVLLVAPSDPGNLGTILRTVAGLDVHDLAVVPPAVDSWDPRVIRASMGSRFRGGRARCGRLGTRAAVTIPEGPDVDSFNLAIAASIALWQLRRPLRRTS